MYRRFATLTACLVLVSIVACQPPAFADAQAAYCADLRSYGEAVQNVHNLSSEANVGEFEEAIRGVDDAYRQLENAAWELADAQTDALRPAYNEIRGQLDAINSGVTVTEAHAVISNGIDTYMVTYEEVVRTSCKDAR